MRIDFRPLSLLGLVALFGCGGSGGGGGSALPIDPVPSTEKGTAKFSVDVATGKVAITPLEIGSTKSAVLGGSAVTFETTTLLSEGGEVGRRAVRVRLKNNLQEALGVGRPIRIQFGAFGPATTYPTDLRSMATVSTPLRDSTAGGYLDGPAGSALLTNPSAVAVGKDGSIYFNGTDNRIRKLSDGYVSTVAQNVPATGLVYLTDAVSGREYLVASCASLNSIKLVPIASGSVTTWAGADNVAGNINGAATTARFSSPLGVGIDASQSQVLVADTTNGAIRAIPFSFVGGNLVAGTVSSRYSGLTNPTNVHVSENRSVAVTETSSNRVRIYNAGSSREAIFGGTLGNVNGDGNVARFAGPRGITSLGNTFYVSDGDNNQIRRIELKDGAAPLLAANWTVSVLAGSGSSGFADGPGTTAIFGNVVGITTDGQGRLLVADNSANAIRRIVSEGAFDFGSPTGSSAGQASLANPTGFADLNGLQRPYIDISQRVEPGQSIDVGEWQFSIPSTVTSFRFAVTVEAGTSVYAGLEAVLNQSGGPGSPNVVAQYLSRNTASGGLVGRIDNVAFDSTTTYMTTDAAGNMYLSEGALRVIRRLDTAGNVTLVAGKSLTVGSTDGVGSDARFGYPNAIQVNAAGTELFVADETNQTIRRIALYYDGADPSIASNWNVTTIAGLASTPGDNNGAGDSARFRGPVALTGPSNDEFFVTEFNGYRIRQLRYIGGNRALAASWYVETAAGANVAGYIDGSGFAARFSNLVGAAYSAVDSKLYICDRGNNRIRAMDLLTRTVSTVAGDGSFGFNDSTTATSANFFALNSVSTDATGAVYVADYNRVRRIFDGAVKTVAGGGNGSGTTGDKVIFGELYGTGMNKQGDLLLNSNGRLVRLTRKLGR